MSIYSPLDVGPLDFWFDATALGLNNGDPVTQWPDLSGNGRHLTPGVNGTPVFMDNVRNGKPVVRFDGVNDALNASIPPRASSTFFIVAQKRTVPSSADHHLAAFTPGGGAMIHSNVNLDGNWHWVFTEAAGTIIAVAANAWHVLALNVVSDASMSLRAENGYYSGRFNPNNSVTSRTGINIGTGFSNQYSDSDVGEIVSYPTSLSNADMNKVGTYLAEKWGLAWTPLPFDPATVSSLRGWYDFSDATTMFTDAAFTTPVSADGQTILSMRDKSGQGNDVTEALNGPTYKTAIQNGLSVGRGDGVNDVLTDAAPNTIPGGNAPLTLFFAMNTGGGNLGEFAGVSSAWNAGSPAAGPGSTGRFTLPAVVSYDFGNYWLGAFDIGAMVLDAQADLSFFRNSSTPLYTSVFNAFGGAPNNFTLFRVNGSFTGDIGEFLVFRGDLRTTDPATFNNVGKYLADKWGEVWLSASDPVIQGVKTNTLRNVVAQATVGQTDWVSVPDWADYAYVEYNLTANAGSSPSTQLVLFRRDGGLLTQIHPDLAAITGAATVQMTVGEVDALDSTITATGVSNVTIPTTLPRVLGIQVLNKRGASNETYTYTLSVRFE